jgi:hypothetical protein
MPADMTSVLDAIESELNTLYPTIPVIQSKRAANDGSAKDAGLNIGSPLTCFVISGDETENVDEEGTFDLVSVGYSILIEYIKPAEQQVTSIPNRPPRVVEDSDVRDKRQAIRQLIYKPQLTGSLGVVGNVKNRPATPYQTAGGDMALCSGQVFEFELYETRADVS